MSAGTVSVSAVMTIQGSPSVVIYQGMDGQWRARLRVTQLREGRGRINPTTKQRKPQQYVERTLGRVIGPLHSEEALRLEVDAWVEAQPADDRGAWREAVAAADWPGQ